MKIAIVTDDLTSATDGAAGFAERAWSARVVRGTSLSASANTADLVSVDVASRTRTRQQAISRVDAAGMAVAHAALVIKQFDSTLRGHVAAETLALLRATKRRRAIVAPAFPAAGRTTIGARQFVDGIPVHESAYAADPLNPVRSNDIRALFEQEGVEVARSEADRGCVFILDGQTEADLTAIASRYIGRSDLVLAGSTGLMRALARVSEQGSHRGSTVPPSRRVLIVVGSMNVRSREQLAALQPTATPIFTITADTELASMADAIGKQFRSGDVVAITTSAAPADPRQVAQRLSHVVAHVIEKAFVDALVVTGGDTLAEILDRLASDSLRVCREIEPGIPLCVLDQPRAITLITKAGGFGSADIFLKALHTLRGVQGKELAS
ncbi:MAG: four-carbon acid sugar kinase family protein [Proteobacteria bacterium]|nr:four-carbon acid sugar kinase family protein [Pseudomonadota bacterium]